MHIPNLRTSRPRWTQARNSLREEQGSALVELSLLLSLLGIPFLTGIMELATLFHVNAEVQEAANAGAAFAMMSLANSTNTAAITSAAKGGALDISSSLTVTPTAFYVCSQAIDGTQYSSQGAAAVVCPAGAVNHYLYFVKVATGATITPPFRFPGLAATFNLTGNALMEVEE